MARLQEFRAHNSKQGSNITRRIRVVKWSAPPVGFLKINVDGAFNHVTRKGGIGFVIRDELGVMLAGGGLSSLGGLLSPEHGEVLACKKAMEFAVCHYFFPVILETDALTVQQQLKATVGSNTTVLGRIYDDLILLLESETFVEVTHVAEWGIT